MPQEEKTKKKLACPSCKAEITAEFPATAEESEFSALLKAHDAELKKIRAELDARRSMLEEDPEEEEEEEDPEEEEEEEEEEDKETRKIRKALGL